jgi:predicted nucleic acid-binding protein
MIFVVDTNILFSACLTPAGRIFDILFNAPPSVQLISGHYAIEELLLHKGKLTKLSGHTAEEIDTLMGSILKQIEFFNEAIIEKLYWQEADILTKNVDSKDISFVALALQTGGKLWTGDKKLAAHLKLMGFDGVVNTAELFSLLNIN